MKFFPDSVIAAILGVSQEDVAAVSMDPGAALTEPPEPVDEHPGHGPPADPPPGHGPKR